MLAAAQVLELDGTLDVLTVAVNGSQLHTSLVDDRGHVLGGHVGYGYRVRTTAEVLLALLPGWHFSREPDAAARRHQGDPKPGKDECGARSHGRGRFHRATVVAPVRHPNPVQVV